MVFHKVAIAAWADFIYHVSGRFNVVKNYLPSIHMYADDIRGGKVKVQHFLCRTLFGTRHVMGKERTVFLTSGEER